MKLKRNNQKNANMGMSLNNINNMNNPIQKNMNINSFNNLNPNQINMMKVINKKKKSNQ